MKVKLSKKIKKQNRKEKKKLPMNQLLINILTKWKKLKVIKNN